MGFEAGSGIEQPEDAIVRIDTTTICGTDLHILKGDVPTVEEDVPWAMRRSGRSWREIGGAGDRGGGQVLVSCISSCGRCAYCKRGCTASASTGAVGSGSPRGRDTGRTRPHPFADNGLYKVPEGLSDEQVLFLSDILPTGFEIGVLTEPETGRHRSRGRRRAGGTGRDRDLRLYGPGRGRTIDPNASRLERAREFGADMIIDNSSEDAVEKVMEATDGLGADVTIEAVGIGDLRAVYRAGAPRRTGRQRWGPRCPPHSILRRSGSRHHHHHRAGGYVLDANPSRAGLRGAPGSHAFRHAPLRSGRDHGRLRRVLRRRQDQRPQSGPLGLVAEPPQAL